MPTSTEDLVTRAEARVGTVLDGKWHLDRVLGVGGMACVYAATHRNQKRAAIKMLHPEMSGDANVRQRFLREGYVANTVDHPGTVTVLDDDVAEDGAAFLVMELLEGETLETRRERKGGSLPAAEVLSIVGQLLDVLAAAHARGIVHRDLKPENLFLTNDGRLKVLDFGIARLRELSASTGHGTQAGSLLGTPGFMAPEQARARWDLVDDRTDLWAVGATMYSLLSGRPVHEAITLNEQLILAATQPAPSIATVTRDLPKSAVEVVDRALAFDREARWPSAKAMREAIRRALEDTLPDGPVSLLVGSGRSSAETDATLAAPSADRPLVTPSGAVAAIRSPTAHTTARPVDVSIARPRVSTSLRAGAIAGALLVVVGGIVAVIATRGTGEAAPVPASSVETITKPAEPLASSPPGAPTEAAPTIASAEPPPSAAPPPTRPSEHHGTVAPKPPAAPPPTVHSDPKPPQTPPPTGKSNPFDRRY